MLRMYVTPGSLKCKEYGKRFVNDRLIKLMEDVMAEYAQMGDDSYMSHIRSSEEWEAPLETVIDLNRMRKDKAFARDWLIEMAYIPETIDSQRALHDFWSLYDLLKARKEYKPDLSMEYILYSIIRGELDFCKDMPECHDKRQRIPEPQRSEMLKELIEEAKEYKEGEPETWDESIPEIAEKLMGYYEDLGEYIETCFEDTDFLFLDDMDEKGLEKSGLVDRMGIHIKGDEAKVRIEGENLAYEYKVRAWETEGWEERNRKD
ncbi:MAG: hypothetical protein K6G27_14645 [Lachnospiraceae bacterium]|nr:hypothetical protein [Lachnospiraceae bacterium]